MHDGPRIQRRPRSVRVVLAHAWLPLRTANVRSLSALRRVGSLLEMARCARSPSSQARLEEMTNFVPKPCGPAKPYI